MMHRLATFRKAQYPLNWRLSFIKLQVAGFSYERSVGRVVCEFCNSSRALAAFHSDPTSPEYHNNGCRFISGPDARHDETAVGAAASNYDPELHSHTAEREQRVAEIRVTSNVHPLYKTYKKRKQSFSEVSRQLKDIHLLASYGFFYGGAGNKIYCFCCGLYLRHRTTAEQVFQQHQHQKPQCRFFQSRRNNEWPPEEENDAGTFLGRWSTFSNAEGFNLFSSHLLPSVLARSGYSYTAGSNGQTHKITHSCGYKRTLNNIEQNPNCPYCNEVLFQEEYGEESDFTTTSIPSYVDKDHPCLVLLSQANSPPSHPVYISLKKRLESFTLWPPTHTHLPADLAAAGFFYAGYADCVRCYQCGLGLKAWRPGEDIHEQHKKFRPYCPFLRFKEQAAHLY